MEPSGARFRRISPVELRERLDRDPSVLLLDVRRAGAFEDYDGLPGALLFPLDREPVSVPDVERGRALVVY